MNRAFFSTAILASLAACSPEAPKKPEDKGAVTEIEHVDLSCTPQSGQNPGQYADVNRISIDLVNNRIDLFSREQIWQFHGINDKKTGAARDIEIAYVGRNIASWGVKTGTPFNFFYDTSKSVVTLAYITNGTPMSVIFQCV